MEGGTDWTYREEVGQVRQEEEERTRLWVCARRGGEYLASSPSPPPCLVAGLGEDPLTESESDSTTLASPSPSLALRDNLVRIETALAKFDLLEHLVALHR